MKIEDIIRLEEQTISFMETMAPEPSKPLIENSRIIISALEKQIPKEPCEYCTGSEKEYQHTIHTKLILNTFGKARTIVTECSPCPPYTQCGMKNVPARSAFPINFCPECGRDLRVD